MSKLPRKIGHKAENGRVDAFWGGKLCELTWLNVFFTLYRILGEFYKYTNVNAAIWLEGLLIHYQPL